MRSERLSLTDAIIVLDNFLAYPITLFDPPRFHRVALALTEAHSLGAHDAHYVALA